MCVSRQIVQGLNDDPAASDGGSGGEVRLGQLAGWVGGVCVGMKLRAHDCLLNISFHFMISFSPEGLSTPFSLANPTYSHAS